MPTVGSHDGRSSVHHLAAARPRRATTGPRAGRPLSGRSRPPAQPDARPTVGTHARVGSRPRRRGCAHDPRRPRPGRVGPVLARVGQPDGRHPPAHRARPRRVRPLRGTDARRRSRTAPGRSRRRDRGHRSFLAGVGGRTFPGRRPRRAVGERPARSRGGSGTRRCALPNGQGDGLPIPGRPAGLTGATSDGPGRPHDLAGDRGAGGPGARLPARHRDRLRPAIGPQPGVDLVVAVVRPVVGRGDPAGRHARWDAPGAARPRAR